MLGQVFSSGAPPWSCSSSGESEGLFILSRLERGTGRRWVRRIPASGHCFNKRQDFPLRKPVPEGCTDCHLLATWAAVSAQRRGIMLMARFLQASTASISLLEEGGPASPFLVILPEDCNVPARNSPLSTQVHSDAGMVCKLHLPQRSQPVTNTFCFQKLKTLVCCQVMDSSSLAPCLRELIARLGFAE